MATKFEFSLTKEDKMTDAERVRTLQEDALEAAIIGATQSIIDSTKFDSLDKDDLNRVKSVALQRFRSQIWPAASDPARKSYEEQVEKLGFSMSVRLNEKK